MYLLFVDEAEEEEDDKLNAQDCSSPHLSKGENNDEYSGEPGSPASEFHAMNVPWLQYNLLI